MQCDYFDAGRCRSCTLMGVPYERQLADKQAAVRAVLEPVAPGVRWLEPFASAESHFRNKAKLVAGGRPGRISLGILDGDQLGIDLRRCGLYEEGLSNLIPKLSDLVDGTRMPPYVVPRRQGELKHIIVTWSPAGTAMVRFVLRSEAEIEVLRHNLDELRRRAPQIEVVTANLLPEHKAVLEGDEEIVITEQDTLAMPVGGVVLHLRPKSFFQTNTAVATGLYQQSREWVEAAAPSSVWDLYCGVGGFALEATAPGRTVVGVESSAEAVASAERSAAEAGVEARFVAADATAYAAAHDPAELVVVNPPRRGIGADLARRLDTSGARHVVYSSCNVTTLAQDLAAMPGFRVAEARLFDMFPQTAHHEVMVRLERV